MSDRRSSSRYNDEYVDISSSTQVKKAYGKKHTARRVISLVLSIIFLFVGCVMVFYYNTLDMLNYEEVDTSTPMNTSGLSSNTVDTDSLLTDENVLNILLFGQDHHEDGSYGRSDTMILLSIDNTHQKLKMVSFLRDTYVSIPGYGQDRINAAFTYGGVKLSIQTVEANFGIAIDKYAMVDFSSFKKIIDVMGGVEMELTRDEILYINAQIDYNQQWNKTPYVEDNGQEKQTVTLNGQQALWYARNRGGSFNGVVFDGDDWSRTDRQRNLLNTIVDSMKTASLTDIVKIVNEIGPLVTTNLKKDDITFLVQNSLTYLNYEMVQEHVPIDGYWKYSWTPSGQSVIEITDWDATRRELAQFVYEDSVVESATTTLTDAPDAL